MNKTRVIKLPIHKNNASKEGGFTLVELIVAMFVFTAAITLAVGIFISGLQAERRLVAEIAGNNAISSALEIMMRDIRTGYNFTINGESEINFFRKGGINAKYELSEGAILRNGKKITGENVSVEDLKFIVPSIICSPWRITILMGVKPKNADITSRIQTTVSSRVLPGDLEEYKGSCRID